MTILLGSAPVFLTDLADVLRGAGLTVVELPGWESAGWAGGTTPSGALIDARTGLVHHTGTAATVGGDFPTLVAAVAGTGDTPGPLYQAAVGRSGTWYVVAAGRANHAGAVDEPDYSNPYSVGVAAEHPGGGAPYPPAQYAALTTGALALSQAYGLTWRGHKEAAVPAGRKVDPDFDMPTFRADVEALMALWSPVLGVVTSPYDLARIHPISKRKIPHLGTDFVARAGADVRALTNGVVVATAKKAPGDTTTNGILPGRSGSCVLVDHGNGVRSYYGHTAPHITPGQKVKGGQVIGRSDGSGNITGPHLHLEVHINGTPVDPEPWAEQRGLDIGITDTNAPPEDDVALTDKQSKALDWLADNLADLDLEQDRVRQMWGWMGGGSNATEFYRIKQTLSAIAGAVAGIDKGGDVDAAVIAAAIPADLARQVADELAKRLAA